jgi:DNA-binding LacI/PurR family transcriptional regulator
VTRPGLLFAPRRELLVDQVAAALRAEIAAGRWREWLPGERSLIRVFNVSRGTLRTALKQLVAARELALVPKKGYRVRPAPRRRVRRAGAANPEVGLICPQRIYSLPSHVVQLVDLVRSLAAEAGLHFELFDGGRFARTDPGRFMPPLVRGHPKACWIPIMADRRLQQWFARTRTPAVIYGNVYPDLQLSSVGIDYRACIRHATSLLLRRGHRRIALVTHDPRRAGEQESIAGCLEAFRAHGDGAPTLVAQPDDDVPALRRKVDRLFSLREPPTAVIAFRTHHYATVATRLLETGRRIPDDVALVCRGEDVFMHFLSPTPALYRVNVEQLARSLFRCVLRTVGGATGWGEQHRIVPDFVPGASLGSAPRGGGEDPGGRGDAD